MTAPRGPERRRQPRREADRLLHYAEQAVLAAALDVDVAFKHDAHVEAWRKALGALEHAIRAYRYADEQVARANRIGD